MLPNFRIFDGARNESRFSEVLARAIAALPKSVLARVGGEKKQLSGNGSSECAKVLPAFALVW